MVLVASLAGSAPAAAAEPHGFALAEVVFSPADVRADNTPTVTVEVRTPRPLDALSGVASGGELGPFASCGNRCFRAAITLSQPPTPRVVMVLVWAPGVAGVGVLPVSSRTELPIETESDSDVLVEVTGREFGPVYSGKTGRIRIPVEVPAGEDRAQVHVRDRVGHTTTKVVDLGVPSSTLVLVQPLKRTLIADGLSESVILVAAATASGKPFRGAIAAEAGLVEVTEHGFVAPGLAVIRIRAGTHAGDGQVQVQVPGLGSRRIALELQPGPPAAVRISTTPAVILSEGRGQSVVRVDVVDEHYNPVPDQKPEIQVVNGEVVEERFDGVATTATVRSVSTPVGAEGATLRILARRGDLATEAGIVVLGPSGYRIVLRPDRNRVIADGASLGAVEVEVMDGTGTLVSGRSLKLRAVGVRVPAEAPIQAGAARFGFLAGTGSGQGWIEATLGESQARIPIDLEPGPPDRLTLDVAPSRSRIGVAVSAADRFGNPIDRPSPVLLVGHQPVQLRPSGTPGAYAADLRIDPAPQSVRVEATCGAASASREVYLDGDWLAGIRFGYLFNIADLVQHRLNSFVGVPIAVDGGWVVPGTDHGLVLVVELAYVYIQSEVVNRQIPGTSVHQTLEADIHAVDFGGGVRYSFLTQSDWLPFVEALAGGSALFGRNVNRPEDATVLYQSVNGFVWWLSAGAGVEWRLGPGRLVLELSYLESPVDMPSQFSDDYRFDANAGGLQISAGYRVSF